MDGNEATNAEGPCSLSLSGAAGWQDKPVDLPLNLMLPAGAGGGQHETGPPGAADRPSACPWMSVRDAGPDAPRPATHVSEGAGSLTLTRRDRTAISGTVEIGLLSRDDPDDRITLSARFDEFPCTSGAVVSVIETTGAVTALDKAMPDDPLIDFFTAAKAVDSTDGLVLSPGRFGPKLELVLPAGHSGDFAAGPAAAVSVSFAAVPVGGGGSLSRDADSLSGEVAAQLGAHQQVDGAGTVTLRFSDVPTEAPV